MQKTKRTISLMLAIALLFMAIMPITALAASKKAINKNDFVIKVGKTSVDLLSEDGYAIAKKAGKKYTLRDKTGYYGYEMRFEEASFYSYSIEKDDSLIMAVELNRKGDTARGVGVESTRKEVLSVYPKPLNTVEHEDSTTYFFGTRTPEDFWDDMGVYLNKKTLPLFIYKIGFVIDNASDKVLEVWYTTEFGE